MRTKVVEELFQNAGSWQNGPHKVRSHRVICQSDCFVGFCLALGEAILLHRSAFTIETLRLWMWALMLGEIFGAKDGFRLRHVNGVPKGRDIFSACTRGNPLGALEPLRNQ